MSASRWTVSEMVLTEIYPEVSVNQVKASCGWPLKISPQLKTTPPPEKHMLELLSKLDPKNLYL